MGVIFTQYYTPSLKIPFIKTIRNRYALVGPTYLAAYEFGTKFRGATVSVFGASGDPRSPHFQDQAELLAAGRMKDELFEWEPIAAGAAKNIIPASAGDNQGQRAGRREKAAQWPASAETGRNLPPAPRPWRQRWTIA